MAGALVLCASQFACGHRTSQPYEIPPAPKSAGADASRLGEAGEFWWGVSTSPYQIEEPPPAEPRADGAAATADRRGFSTDWDLFVRTGKLPEARDGRIASFAHFERDIEALKYLGVSHYRFGVEWARVEPSPGRFDDAAIDAYVTLARRLGEEGITPIVCLWHFTLPDWLCNFDEPDAHGWFHPGAAAAWERYVERMARALGPQVEMFAPQNEPNIYALAVGLGLFPPGKRLGKAYYDKLIQRQAELFIRAAEIIRVQRPGAMILSVQNIIHWEQDAFDFFGIWYDIARRHNYEHLDRVAAAADIIGFNYYQREVASPLALWAQSTRRGEAVSDLGWIIDPRGLEEEAVGLARRYGKPMVILENGIADAGDDKRQLYLIRHVQAVRRLRRAGYDLRGYFHWSLMDNYEWMHGYGPKFGLFALRPGGAGKNQQAGEPTGTGDPSLVPKPSASLYRFLIRNGLSNAPASQPTGNQSEARLRP